jgi:hypothetical protein
MFTDSFDKVDWPNVQCTLNKEVPRLFQVWACNQVMNSSTTNKNLWRRCWDSCSYKYPCCTIHVETAEQVILCPEVGSVEAFMQSSQALERWLEEANTDPDLIDCIVDYVQGRGTITMASAMQNSPPRFQAFRHLQNIIGWRQFLEEITAAKMTRY